MDSSINSLILDLTNIADDPRGFGVVAILSSTVLSREGTYQYVTFESMPCIAGLRHYVGHPATKHILDSAGAVHTLGYFAGLEVGQAYLTCQLRDPRKGMSFTQDKPNVDMLDLKFGYVKRIE
jgi:hypothetical protein